MQNVVKRKWGKEPDGKYSIYDVDVFRTFNDETRGSVSEEDARVIIKNFEEDKKIGYYPRVHIGHHSPGYQNQPGVGYMDNLRFKDGVFFSDLVKLDGGFIEDIKQRSKYPYRSVEYNPKDKRITSVALLESRAPYHKSSILEVEESPMFFQEDCFMLEDNPLKGKAMPDEVKKVEEPQVAEAPKEAPKEVPKEAPKEDPSAALMSCMQDIKALLVQLIGLEKKEQVVNQPEVSVPPKSEKDAAVAGLMEESIRKPNSVAYQEDPIQKFQAEIKRLTEEVQLLKSQGTHEARLKAMSETRPSINFQKHFQILQMFKDDASKTNYLNILETDTVPAIESPATKFQAEFPETTVMSKFQNEPLEYQKLARQAYQDYCDTVNQTDRKSAEMFQAIWPDVNKFVSHIVETEKASPGYYHKFSY